MPCYSDYGPSHRKRGKTKDEEDDESDSSASDCSSSDESSDEEEDESGYGTLTGAMRAACEMAELIRMGWKGTNGFKMLSTTTRAWVERHDEVDRERLEREKKKREKQNLKEKALNKLSKKEREALGL
jgi:hypothetical protein